MTADKSTPSGQREGTTAESGQVAQGQQELRDHVAHTRQELGDTVAALAAKVDVKARAREWAEQMRADMGARASRAGKQASRQAGRIQHDAQELTGRVGRTVADEAAARWRAGAALTATVAVMAAAWLAGRRLRSRKTRRRRRP